MPIYRGSGGSGNSNTSANANQVAIDAAAAAQSATDAAASAAAALVSENEAESAETNAEISETNASNSATASANSATASSNSATASAASATLSDGSALASSDSATLAANSATAAANSETASNNSETAAANSATSAANSASSAAGSATSAGQSASMSSASANASAINAVASANSATASADSAAAAQAAQEAIDGLYLGAQASDPTLDLNGDPVTVGDWYFNTTINKSKIYNGSGWDVLTSDGSVTSVTGAGTVNGVTLTGTVTTAGNLTLGGTLSGITASQLNSQDISQWTNDSGYLTSYTETDTLDSVTSRGATTTNAVTVGSFTSTGIDDNATSTKLTITDSGIAATLTTAAQPNITSVGTLSSLSVTGDLTVDTNTLYVDSTNDRVGIGEGDPSTALDVSGDTTFKKAGGTVLILENSTSGGYVGDGTELQGAIYFKNNDSSGDGDHIGAKIESYVSDVIGRSNLEFYTGRSDTDLEKRMTISHSGRVGIGTSSPTEARLVIEPATQGDTPIHVDTLTTGIGTINPIIQAQGLIDTTLVRMNFVRGSVSSSGGITFDTTNVGTTAERMRIDSSGNVGIGTTDPSAAKLQVLTGATGTIAQFRGADTDLLNIDGDSNAITLDARNVGAFNIEMQGTNALGINSSGNVGIGKAPEERLTVNGNINVSPNSTSAADRLATKYIGKRDSGTAGWMANIGFEGAGNNGFATDMTFSTRGGDNYNSNTVERMRIDSSGRVGIGTDDPTSTLDVSGRFTISGGSALANSVHPYMRRDGGNLRIAGRSDGGSGGNIMICTGASEDVRVTVDPSGNLLVGQTSSIASRVEIKGASNTSSDYSLFCRNSDSTLSFYVRNDGIINVGQDGNSPYNYSVSGRDLYVDSAGTMGYLSSTRESKDNIEPLGDISWLYDLNAVSFNYRTKDDETNAYTEEVIQETEYGLIAEEVEQVNADLCFYDQDEEGTQTLAGVTYRKLIPVLTKAIQEQQAMIETLQAQVAELQGAN